MLIDLRDATLAFRVPQGLAFRVPQGLAFRVRQGLAFRPALFFGCSCSVRPRAWNRG